MRLLGRKLAEGKALTVNSHLLQEHEKILSKLTTQSKRKQYRLVLQDLRVAYEPIDRNDPLFQYDLANKPGTRKRGRKRKVEIEQQ